MTTIDDLRAFIDSGALRFDPDDDLPRQLLGEPPAEPVTEKLQQLVAELCAKLPAGRFIRISSLRRRSTHHGDGRAVDIGNEDIAAELLPLIATQAEVDRLGIDEILFDARVIGERDPNKYNFDAGRPHPYPEDELKAHRDHFHLSVRE